MNRGRAEDPDDAASVPPHANRTSADPGPVPAADPIPRGRSLLVRTSLALGVALVLAFVALLLVLRPYLASAFAWEGTLLLQGHEERARTDAREADQLATSTLGAGVKHAWDTARAVVADAPLETAADAAASRKMLDARLGAAEKAHTAALTAIPRELETRSAERLDGEWRAVSAHKEERAQEFGDEIAWRAATVLLALLAVLFAVHGIVLYRSVLAPVTRLSDATRDVAEGRLATRIPVEGDDEVARLARSFNVMTESLERALFDLRTLNATLEDRVRSKTAEVEARERELRRADKMASLGTLAGGVAHEFNNLLGGIQGCAEDGLREGDAEELRTTLAIIERTARRGTAITQNLLRFARPEAGGRRTVDLAEVARDVATLVSPEATRARVGVVVDAPAPVSVVAEPSGMHQVVLNLVTNAIHAMEGRSGSVTIAVARDADAARVAVRDEGAGIAPEHRERLFEPFFTTRAEGTGLGLSVSYGIVRSHGGRIDVESEPGRGSVFTVVLPIAGGSS